LADLIEILPGFYIPKKKALKVKSITIGGCLYACAEIKFKFPYIFSIEGEPHGCSSAVLPDIEFAYKQIELLKDKNNDC